jgi:hypothetical protein
MLRGGESGCGRPPIIIMKSAQQHIHLIRGCPNGPPVSGAYAQLHRPVWCALGEGVVSQLRAHWSNPDRSLWISVVRRTPCVICFGVGDQMPAATYTIRHFRLAPPATLSSQAMRRLAISASLAGGAHSPIGNGQPQTEITETEAWTSSGSGALHSTMPFRSTSTINPLSLTRSLAPALLPPL